MRNNLYNIEPFLKQSRPFLIGFSGGSDSLALAHSLHSHAIAIHLAHFDHGWREKSYQEVQKLSAWAKNLGIPFHTQRSANPQIKELEAREQRYAFFEELFASKSYEALVLAHHADDQAETILKRVLEGAQLFNLKSMQHSAMREKMPIWRPLLAITKKEIAAYNEANGLDPIEDETNFDPKYLRARMRSRIIPDLAQKFEKNIAPPLARLGEYSLQLDQYMEEKTQKFLPKRRNEGLEWDFSGAHPFEIAYILNRTSPRPLSHHLIKKIVAAVQKKTPHFRVEEEFLIKRNYLFFQEEAKASRD